MNARCEITRRSSVVRLALILACLLPLAGGSAAITRARGAEDVTVNLAVVWADTWSAQPNPGVVPGATADIVLTQQPDTAVVANGDFSDPGESRLEALDGLGAAAGSVTMVEDGSGTSPQYWLDLTLIDQVPHGAFTLARSTLSGEAVTISMFVAPVASFATGLARAQAEIIVDGSPFLDGVGPDGVQAILEENLSRLSSGTPVTDDESASGEATPDDGESQSGAEEDIPYADAGMVGPNTYVSPQFGARVEWSEDWSLDEDFGEAVTTEPDIETDFLHLLWNEDLNAWMMVYTFDTHAATIEQFIDFADSSTATEDTFGETAEVVLSGSRQDLGAVVTLVEVDELILPYLVYEEVHYGPDRDSFVIVQLTSIYPDVTEAAIEAASNDVTVDGERVLTFFPAQEVAAAHAAGGGDGEQLEYQPTGGGS